MRTLLLFFLILCCGTMSAQVDSVQEPKQIHYDDRADLQPVSFDKDQLNNYKNDSDFDYAQKINTKNWWERFVDWISYIWNSFWEWLFGDIQGGSVLAFIVEALKYIIIAAILALIVWLFIRLNPGNAFLKTKTPPEVLLSDEERIIHEKDIPALIEEALQEQNFRLAVRYHYLLILKRLKDEDLIDYRFEKTNEEYHAEISDAAIGKQFGAITRLYDFIWYGDFPVDKAQYDVVESEFKQMQSQLKNPVHV